MLKLFCLLIILVILTVPVHSHAEVVHPIYFRPTDAPAASDEVVSAMRIAMINARQFYRDEIERHGYGAKTFNLEIGDDGKVVVHTVNGIRKLDAYTTMQEIDKELPQHIGDALNDIRVVFLGGAVKIRNGAITFISCQGDKCGATALVPAERDETIIPLTAHEIGHAFGLQHNPESLGLVNFIMKPVLNGVEGLIQDLNYFHLDDYEARWLDNHKYFNDPHAVGGVPEVIKFHNLIPIQIEGIQFLKLKVDLKSDNDLFQAQVSRMDGNNGMVVGWDKISGRKDSAEFNIRRSQLSNSDRLLAQIIDVRGYIKREYVSIKLHDEDIALRSPTLWVNKTHGNGRLVVMWSKMKIK